MTTLHRARFAPLAAGMFLLLLGLAAGLVRLGWEIPLPHPASTVVHGSLMVGGFLGTLICLERAVALARPWAYAAPLFTAAGGIWLVVVPGSFTASLLITLGSLLLVYIFRSIIRRQPDLSTVCMGLGALAWLAGNLLWCTAWPPHVVVPWWIGFLLLTIAGERLELNRLLELQRSSRIFFLVLIAAFIAGALLNTAAFVLQPEAASAFSGPGSRLLSLAMLGLSLWLLYYDLARRTVRQQGLTRFIAVCLLSGYVWLGCSGLLGLVYGAVGGGPLYDAVLHTFFLGFVFAMIFGHAPIIFPALLGVSMRFRPTFYIPLALLHLTLALRLVGDLAYWLPGQRWGGLLNALAIAAFLANNVYAVRTASTPDQGETGS